MIKNYFKIALRHLKKNKLYTFVNVAGLAIGIASCLLIGIYIFDELSFDKFHSNADRIARITMDYNTATEPKQAATTGTKAGPQFKRTFPQVEAYVRTLKFTRVISYEDKTFEEKNFLYADSAFFNVFSFPLLYGDKNTVLDAPNKLVITDKMAKKYFGQENPIGKTVKIGSKDFEVSGMVANAPQNSQIKFDFIGSFTTLNASKEEKWWEANYITYLLLGDKNVFEPLQKSITAYMQTVSKNELQLTGNSYLTYHLEPFTKVRLYSNLDGLEPNSDIVYIYVLGIVAFLILVIACVNYTNLSIAQSANRNAEVGIRKVLGAGRGQLFRQHISETAIITFIALIIAVLLALILLPYFNQLSGKELSYHYLGNGAVVGALLVGATVIALTAGTYPALIMSRSKVINILKSGFAFTGSGALRKTLMVLQFVISAFLITATIVILQQMAYIQHKDLGYNKEQVMVLPVDAKISEQYDVIKAALANNKGVLSVAGAYEPPTHINWSDAIRKGNSESGEKVTVTAMPVDEDIVKTLGLRIIAGTDYSMADVKSFDTSEGGKNLHHTYMINEAAAKALGWTPEEAVGKTISKATSGIIKAVVKDFHFKSFHESITPLVIFMDKRLVGSLFVKVDGNNTKATISALEKVWKERVPNRPFEYHFLDEDYDALYRAEQRTAGVFATFSFIAIVLACLGLFAMTAYTLVQRTKEIGIRKILGATVGNIMVLISKDFVRLIVIAMFIAIPVALFATHKWLDNFAYKTAIHWWVPAVACITILVIALVTIALQSFKTAVTNPVKNLRTD